VDDERGRLAVTFDQAADLYQRARPEYPSELFDRVVEIAHLSPGARLLEVGCATGKATLPLARRGYRITCMEPGGALAAAARKNLAGLDVDVVEARFEDWTPAGEPFAMVFAATAWHWVDRAVRYRKAADVLEPRGYLAVWAAGHVIPYDGDPFFEELQDIMTRSASPVRPTPRCHARRSWETTAARSRPAGCSRSSMSRGTTGKPSTTPGATSTC
jgi:SAM-dependent methyltransferase